MSLLQKARNCYLYSEEGEYRVGKLYPFPVLPELPYNTGFDVVELPWGVGIWDCAKEKWIRVILKCGQQELNLEELNVEVTEYGIDFLDVDD